MLQKGNHIEAKANSLLRPVLNLCLLALLCLFSITDLHPPTSTGQANQHVSQQDDTFILSRDLFTGFHYPAHLPLESVPTNAPETPDENELKCKSKDDWSPFIGIYSAAYSLVISGFEKSIFLYTNKSFQNRSTVPLFILYNSWKSYLI